MTKEVAQVTIQSLLKQPVELISYTGGMCALFVGGSLESTFTGTGWQDLVDQVVHKTFGSSAGTEMEAVTSCKQNQS